MSGPRKGVGLSSWLDTVPCAHPQVARGQGCCSDLTASNLGGHLWATALASVRGAWASGALSAAARAGLALDTEHSTTSLLGTTCSHLRQTAGLWLPPGVLVSAFFSCFFSAKLK